MRKKKKQQHQTQLVLYISCNIQTFIKIGKKKNKQTN